MSDPKLAEVLNPRLALRRKEEEAEAAAGRGGSGQQSAGRALQVAAPIAPASRFGKKWSPEELARQNAALARILSEKAASEARRP